jgi:hypothetical protein
MAEQLARAIVAGVLQAADFEALQGEAKPAGTGN